MNITSLHLPLAQTWDAAHQPAHYISRAHYAVLREGRVELVLGPHEFAQGVATMHLCYAGHEGLHYDADSSISPSYMASLLSSKEADVTADWSTCEAYLVQYARAQGLE